ncbi:apoptosis-enhancing nuclease-like [Gastrophryne carolinensis]
MDGAATSSFTGSSEESKISLIRSRRKSRKHQRFMKRKAFLQRHGLLATENQDSFFIFNKDHSFKLQSNDQNANCPEDQSAKLAELKAVLLPPMASSLHSTSSDDDSGLSVSGSCTSSRLASPVPWHKPANCVAIDCEMVGTGPAGRIGELARCSIVGYGGDVVYDKYIKPELPVTDYRTRWSGITARHMKNAVPFKTAKKEILNILKDKRIIGHALHNDFKVLKYYHPVEQTIDTSNTPLLNRMAELPERSSPSLKNLAFCLLHKKIQVGRRGHCSVEDARTCMELYKLVEDQLERHFLSSLEECSLLNKINYMDDQYWPSDLNKD